MKLRRAMAVAAATAAIAPAAFLAAPAAQAAESIPSTASPSPSVPSKHGVSPAPGEASKSPKSQTPSEGGETPGKAAHKSPSAGKSPVAEPSSPDEGGDDPAPGEGVCKIDDPSYKSKLTAKISGLPGKIQAGSGWHNFDLKVSNTTKETVSDVLFYAGVGSSDPDAPLPFEASKVALQVNVNGTWTDVKDGDHSGAYLDLHTFGPSAAATLKLRMDVKKNAPIGKGLTIGGGIYMDTTGDGCIDPVFDSVVLQIVAPGTKTEGTTPQTGGQVPISGQKPTNNNTTQLTGDLAETGSSSLTPTLAVGGGIAVLAGGGVLFAMKRRKNNLAS
ncbi:LAETG motif-containing sortase-dependent surface protein [Streptomyces hundungensis]|nr:LAETG motif-containing sortase-dependent surface protein [Streptomyces hundungensis]